MRTRHENYFATRIAETFEPTQSEPLPWWVTPLDLVTDPDVWLLMCWLYCIGYWTWFFAS